MQCWRNSSLNLTKYSLRDTTAWLQSLKKYGFAILADTPHDKKNENREFYDEVASKLNTRTYKSMYGDVWDTAGEFGNPTHDASYYDVSLAPHTDMTYVKDTPKYQVATMLHASEIGGETILVDGAAVLRKFKELYPESFRSLAAKSFLFVCSEKKYSARHRLFGGEDGAIHHRDDLMEKTDLEEYDQWKSLILDPYFHMTTKLLPGDTMVLNNHRVFHGRNEFKGYRNLRGTYFQ